MLETILNQQKKSTSNQVNVAVGATSTPFVPRNMHRTALMLCATGATDVFLGFGVPAVQAQGIILPTGLVPIILTLLEHGAMVFGPINAIGNGGVSAAAYVETQNNAP